MGRVAPSTPPAPGIAVLRTVNRRRIAAMEVDSGPRARYGARRAQHPARTGSSSGPADRYRNRCGKGEVGSGLKDR